MKYKKKSNTQTMKAYRHMKLMNKVHNAVYLYRGLPLCSNASMSSYIINSVEKTVLFQVFFMSAGTEKYFVNLHVEKHKSRNKVKLRWSY